MSKIISAGNPILKNVAAPVEVFDKKLKFLVIDMKKLRYGKCFRNCDDSELSGNRRDQRSMV